MGRFEGLRWGLVWKVGTLPPPGGGPPPLSGEAFEGGDGMEAFGGGKVWGLRWGEVFDLNCLRRDVLRKGMV